MTSQVAVELMEGGVLLIRLARPEKKNALTGAMYDALTAALTRADEDHAVRAVVLTGSGGSFTAGNDLADFLAVAEGAQGAARPAHAFIARLVDLGTPLVAAVEGVAVGIGTTLTLHCDLVYAAPSALFRMPFVDLGLVPEAGSTFLLPRRVGTAKATELLMLAEPYGAAEALRLGLVNAVIEADQLVAHAVSQARRLAAKPPDALCATRRLLRGDSADLKSAIELEMAAFTAALKSPEAKAAFSAFLARGSSGQPANLAGKSVVDNPK